MAYDEDGNLKLQKVKEPWKWIVPVGEKPYCLLAHREINLYEDVTQEACLVVENEEWHAESLLMDLAKLAELVKTSKKNKK